MKQALSLCLLAIGYAGCSSLTPAERARYAIDGIKAVCSAYEQHADIPGEVKAELDAICPELALARVERDGGE